MACCPRTVVYSDPRLAFLQKSDIHEEFMMKKYLRAALIVSSLILSQFAFSLELTDAKTRGLVGEQPDGYLAAVGVATTEIAALVNDINAKRKAAYAEIAQRNGTPIDAVEQLAGKKAIEKTPSGQYVRLPAGDWLQVK
jgi:uncharacterized protein YdbL (DUF1318 family)